MPKKIDATDARAGENRNLRYMLAISLTAAVVAMVVIVLLIR
jgi:hypothetical protein